MKRAARGREKERESVAERGRHDGPAPQLVFLEQLGGHLLFGEMALPQGEGKGDVTHSGLEVKPSSSLRVALDSTSPVHSYSVLEWVWAG